MRGIVLSCVKKSLFLLLSCLAAAQVPVLTQRYDSARDGLNANETTLTLGNVNSSTFGKLFSLPVDGRVYAQPLYVPGLSIPGNGTHNVTFVATGHDSVYAYDADGLQTQPLWTINLATAGCPTGWTCTSVPSSVGGTTDVLPEVGVLSTPVIDSTTQTIYVVAKTQEVLGSTTNYIYRLHALNILTGTEQLNSPVVIQGQVTGSGSPNSGGSLVFSPSNTLQRPGLALTNNEVYIAFGSWGDNGGWHGWAFGYDESSLARTGLFSVTPNGTEGEGGIWMHGGGITADSGGYLYFSTGNGGFDGLTNYSDSYLKLATPGLTVADYFTPFNQSILDAGDLDIASGGLMLLPDIAGTTTYPHILIGCGKNGAIYVVDRDNMGQFNSAGDTQIIQELLNVIGGTHVSATSSAYENNCFSSPAYWQGNVYWGGVADTLKLFTFSNGLLSSSAVSQSSETYAFPGSNPIVSANGATQGIVWTIENSNPQSPDKTGTAAILHAYNATNLTELYNSTEVAADAAGLPVKFSNPVVANGKVYVPTQSGVTVYGLLGSMTAAMPTFSPVAGTYSTAQSVTINDTTSGATIYYTTNGTTPTTFSAVFNPSAPIAVSSNMTIEAIAAAPGFSNSAVGSAGYVINLPPAAMPTFSPVAGTYSTAQSVTINDTTSGATIYYTTNGTTPTTFSAVFNPSAPLAVSANMTIEAIAAAPGFSNSAVGSATYVITNGNPSVNYSSGFTSTGLAFNGTAALKGTSLQLTNGGGYQAASSFYTTPLNIQSFTTSFSLQLTSASADGMAFVIQNTGTTVLGPDGGGLGYGPDAPGGTAGIGKSIAVKFDLYSNVGEGNNSTGLYTNGASPTTPATTLGGGVSLHNGDVLNVQMTYDGTTLTMTITDASVPADTFTTSWPINIPSTVGGSMAYVGFTAGTGGLSATQNVLTWTFNSGLQPPAAAPTFTPVAGTYTSAQSVTINDTISGATIYYTTNGTTPTTSSAVFNPSSPIAVSSNMTIQAIAVAAGFNNSTVASAGYVINLPPAAMPTFTPVANTYSTAQSVTINDTTIGATIYYTTNGTTPTTSSAVFNPSAPIAVSSNMTIEAIAAAPGFSNSAVGSAGYVINLPPAAMPTFSPVAGTYSTAQSVTINDTTSGATIYYTTNGTTPTTSSAVFNPSAPIAVSSNMTIEAIAAAPGFSNSAVGSAGYVINLPPAAMPTFSPVAGTYSTAQSVTINDTTSGATIYYTTNGTTPTTFSAVFNPSAPLAVSANMTIEAIAAAPGFSNSAVGSATYVITNGNPSVNYSSGFTSTGLAFNGTAALKGTSLQLTNGGGYQAASSFYTTPLNIQSFTTSFSLQLTSASADGMAFVIQNTGTTVLGPDGGGLGYGPDAPGGTAGIGKSIAVKFDLYSNVGEGNNSTGLYTNGASPTTPATTLGGGVSLHNGDVLNVQMTYDGTTLTMTITDASVPADTFTTSWPINIPSTVGGSMAYVGFTAGTGGLSATQNVLTWTFNSGLQPPAAAPTFTPVAGTYTSAQSVTINDTISGATIYYTTNGTTPTTSSAVFNPSSPIAVSSNMTIQAIAVAAGFNNSTVASAGYVINLPPAAMPTFTPVANTYSTAQSVTINDTTIGATIYYTTNGTTPTTSSAVFNPSAPIAVSSNMTIEAIAAAPGFSNSAVGSAGYVINLPPAAMPTFSPVAGTYSTAQSVTINDTTSGATIYYTTNGTTPTTSSAVFNPSAPIAVSSNMTIEAIAAAPGFSNSAVGSAGYVINLPPAAMPTFSPVAGTYSTAQSVTINDTTSGATIYYTTNGTTPTTFSAVFNPSAPIAVSSNMTIEAIAAAPGFSNSAVGSAGYVINLPPAAMPTFSPVAGTYSTAQSVTINDTTSGATIYYTTNGTTPTTFSAVFNPSAPLAVSANMTIEAIAAAPGFSNSAVGSATYVITNGNPSVNYSSGFTSTGLAFNGTAALKGTSLQLTNGGGYQAASSFYTTPLNIQSFTTSFSLQLTSASADGMAFVIQNTGTTVLGPDGGGLGYGPDAPGGTAGIGKSIAVKFDLYSNVGEGNNSTGLYTNGASPTTPATTLGGGVSLHNGDVLNVQMTYDGTTLTMTITDASVPADTFTTSWPINIPSTVGGSMAYVGFTAGTGGLSATQNVLTWTFNSGN